MHDHSYCNTTMRIGFCMILLMRRMSLHGTIYTKRFPQGPG